jgi:hypothetical protein
VPKSDTQYKKGQPSANPGGRPKILAKWRESEEAQRLRDLSYKALEEAVTAEDIEWKDRIHAASILLDRTEGKVPQAITGANDGPLKIEASDGMLEVLGTMA